MYETYRGTGRWNRFVMFDGCRYCPDLGYLDRLERYASEDRSLSYCPTVTREPADSPWTGCRGRVTEYLQPEAFRARFGFDLDPTNTHVFLCGNPAMIDQCEGELTQLGFVVKDRQHPDGNLHFERYW
jgi:ferredoxin--NADP+ reductase